MTPFIHYQKKILCSLNQLILPYLHGDELCWTNFIYLFPHNEHFFFLSICSPLKVSSGLAASPTSPSAAPLRNQTPSPLHPSLEQDLVMTLTAVGSWLQLSRHRWTTWTPWDLALPATSAPVRATHTWVRCHGCWWRGETRVIKVKWTTLDIGRYSP